jgi:SAM-dependent methyltransferase
MGPSLRAHSGGRVPSWQHGVAAESRGRPPGGDEASAMTIDPRERFCGLAAVYQRSRPSYPGALLDWLVALFAPGAPRTAADVGCGTGIATRLLAARGLDVVGVDPNEEMLAEARALGGARYVRGDAEATGLPDASADLVTAAQAFHWFDAERAFAEFARIVRLGGWCAAFWNERAASPMNDEYERLLRTFSEEYVRLERTQHPTSEFAGAPDAAERRRAVLANAQRLGRDGFLGRVASSSYVQHGTSRRDELLREMAALFDRHERGGEVEIAYECRVTAWRPRAAG